MMRYTVVDDTGTVSFVGPCHVLKALAAGCSRGASDHRALISLLDDYDGGLSNQVLHGLMLFDEHNTAKDPHVVHDWLEHRPPVEMPPFRVLDEVTRNASLQPVKYGLIVFNLVARRIVQVQNSYADLRRSDRGRIRVAGKPTRKLYRYDLPEDWLIVP
ncbi:MAG TPA: hypothetical protein VFL82_13700 [Thermomicrobiales bacterium]|nr:hypothetical protein [Thermomicrobiales bacterium]